MEKFISFSGGVESRTMAILYGKGATILFTDTGAEHSVLYQSLRNFIEWLIDFHKGDVKFQAIYPPETLTDAVRRKKFMPSPIRRYCTFHYKIEPIEKFLASVGECELMIGFNADEYNRVGNKELLKNVHYAYPLQQNQLGYEFGLNREDCEDLLRFYGQHPNFPAYMSRGGCKFCFFKSEKEYKAMYVQNPAEFAEVEALEKEIQDKRGKFYSIMPSGKSMAQLRKEVDSEKNFLGAETIAQMYKEAKKRIICGAFCNR